MRHPSRQRPLAHLVLAAALLLAVASCSGRAPAGAPAPGIGAPPSGDAGELAASGADAAAGDGAAGDAGGASPEPGAGAADAGAPDAGAPQGDAGSDGGAGGAGSPPGFLENGRWSYCDPSSAIAAYPRYPPGGPRPEVLARLYPGGGGRDYAAIDVHTHLPTTAAAEADLQARAGLHAVVDAAWDAASTARLRAAYPAPNLIQFALNPYLDRLDAGSVGAILAAFDAQRAAGAGGIKIFKSFGLELADATGARLRIDDPRLDPLWQRAGQLGWTVSIHVGDPNTFLPAAGPPKQELVSQLVHVVARNPRTVFVAIHLLNLVDAEEELDQLGELLRTLPNLYADVAARSQYLVLRDRDHVRRFVAEHADALLFATDRTVEGLDGYEQEFRYWETSGPTRTFYQNYDKLGLGLPPDALEKLYYRTALRAFCGALR